MLNVNLLLENAIRPVLKDLNMYSKQAEALMLGTAIQESSLFYLKQLNNGPALGLYQMEPRAHNDIHANYLIRKPELRKKVYKYSSYYDLTSAPRMPIAEEMIGNPLYATVMARVHYWRVPAPIPEKLEDIALYWKEYYNTRLGAGCVSEFIDNYLEYTN